MLAYTLVLMFILRIKYGKLSIANVVYKQYGIDGLGLFRSCEKSDLRLKKLTRDPQFLECCYTNNLRPKFLNFKTALDNFYRDADYDLYQRRLLEKEIGNKRLLIDAAVDTRGELFGKLKSMCTYLDFHHFSLTISNINAKKDLKVRATHDRKLFNLGLQLRYDELPASKIIFNVSKIKLTELQIEALSKGLQFCFSPSKLNYTRQFLAFENLYRKVSTESIYKCLPDAGNFFRIRLKDIAYRSFYSRLPKLSDHHKKLLAALKPLSRDKSIVVTKPDKGKGVVILDKDEYLEKISDLLGDSSKFLKVDGDPYKILLKQEDRINRFVDQLQKTGIIEPTTRSTSVPSAHVRA